MPTQVVHYIFEEAVNGVAEARITVGTVSVLGIGEHAKREAEYRAHLTELAGFEKGKQITQAQYNDLDPTLRAYSQVWMRWARIASALRKVQVKLEGIDEFVDGALSDLGWDTLEGLASLPGDLLEELDRRTIQCNPGVWGLYSAPEGDDDPNARKVGVVKK